MKPAENYILKQSTQFREILMHLQSVIQYHFPEVELKFKWKIPFFTIDNKPFCYLNCVEKKGYVDVGLWMQDFVSKYDEFLVSENRKVVKSLRYKTLESINNEILIAVLSEIKNRKDVGFYQKK